jgi:DNA (cytosine-5)-methyltransferase 1
VFAVLRERDGFLTAAQIAAAVQAAGAGAGAGVGGHGRRGPRMSEPAVLRRLSDLGRDFHVETTAGRDGLAYRLGEFKAFLGQVDHVRHEQFSLSRSTIS